MSVATGTRGEVGDTQTGRETRTLLLRLVLVSIAVNAGLAIWALLLGDFGQTEGKVLLTSVLVSAAMLTVLANRVPYERRLLWPLPSFASAVAVAAFGLLIVTVWAEIENEIVIKMMVSGFIVAAGATLANLLALVDVPTSFIPLARAANVLIAIIVVTGLVGLWAEIDEVWYARLVGVESVLVAALTLALPVIARFAPGEPTRPPAGAASSDEIAFEPSRSDHPATVDQRATLRTVIDALVDADESVVLVGDGSKIVGAVRVFDVLSAIRDGADLDQVWAADIMTDALKHTALNR